MDYAPQEKNPEQRSFSMMLYLMTAFAALAQYAESWKVVVAGCVVCVVASFMVKAQRVTAKDTIYASHVEWTGRTLSIGLKFIFPLSLAIASWLVYDLTHVDALRKFLATTNNDPGIRAILIKSYISRNEGKIDAITTWSITPPIFWWVRRCWFGFLRARKSEPIDFPYSYI